METEKLGLESNKKLILCTPPFDNNIISKECTKTLKQIIVNQPKTFVRIFYYLLFLIETLCLIIYELFNK